MLPFIGRRLLSLGPLLLAGWTLAVLLYYLGVPLSAGVLAILAVLFVGVIMFARRTRRAIVRKNAELETRVEERTELDGLDLAEAGVTLHEKGFVNVDDRPLRIEPVLPEFVGRA